MMKANNKIVFDKRSDVHRKYRNEINKESIKSLDPLISDPRLTKAKKAINSIDPNILKPIKVDVSLSTGNQVNIDFSSGYKMLEFDVENLNRNVIEDIKRDCQKIDEIKNSYFIYDEQNEKLDINKYKHEEQLKIIEDIKTKIDDLGERIRLFPQTSKNDLQVLENSLAIAKTKKEPISDDLKVKTDNVKTSKDLKKIYFISLFLAIGFLVVAIIMVVLLLVL